MGLDQYVYKCSKIGKKTLLQLDGKREAAIDWREYMALRKDGVDEHPEMYSDLMDILQPIKLVETLINMYRIREDNDVPSHYEIGFRSTGNGKTTWKFYGESEEKPVTVSLTDDELKPYIYDQPSTYYICRCKEVYYMRKHYDTQDAIYDAYDGDIQNCGYHHMSQEMIEVLNDMEGKRILDPNAKTLYYHEWY